MSLIDVINVEDAKTAFSGCAQCGFSEIIADPFCTNDSPWELVCRATGDTPKTCMPCISAACAQVESTLLDEHNLTCFIQSHASEFVKNMLDNTLLKVELIHYLVDKLVLDKDFLSQVVESCDDVGEKLLDLMVENKTLKTVLTQLIAEKTI